MKQEKSNLTSATINDPKMSWNRIDDHIIQHAGKG